MEEKKVALVTGAASGIGKVTAQRFESDGYSTVCVDRYYESYLRTAEHWKYDLRDERAVIRIFESVELTYGKLDVLVNNAAIHIAGSVEDTLASDFDELVAVNMRAPFLCARQAMPLLRKTSGTIINVASGL